MISIRENIMIHKILLCVSLILVTQLSFADDEDDTPSQAREFHDADPRNTQNSLGLAADQDGDMKITFGTGGANLYGDDAYATQTILNVQYHAQAEQTRIRNANFDERFGGVYIDVSMQDIIDMYSIGYMVPMEGVGSNTLFFPSINYTRAEFNSNEAADALLDSLGGRIEIDGIEYSRDAIADIITNIGLKGDDSADLASLTIYAMKPWNETHYSLAQVTSGSSYSGFDMEIIDLYFMQGMRATVSGYSVNFFVELEYSETTIQGVETETEMFDVGFMFKF